MTGHERQNLPSQGKTLTPSGDAGAAVSLGMDKVSGFLILLLFIAACEGGGGSGHSTAAGVTSTGAETNNPNQSEVLALINQHRGSLGLVPVEATTVLNEESQAHAEDMAVGRVDFGHDGFSDRCAEARSELGGGNACGEIVAMGQVDAEAVVQSWLNSAGHRARIEDGRYNRAGVGRALDSEGRPYWGVLFLQR